ncbi:hypothetical protein G6O69_21840 [Pseudenhygromyxa sp. WMMC2535]|uniref:hypothetical protein n=1 Tax=Pseudenhygromyxa sp. WMMC2535 TaxID=2712867 RepID=UPI001557F638|nr:hypothetical protein [Pseudenhygromyxa sp. WMMC2535]NVB40498.1 hypothetical protein [Pseudenhygromyxa sp. WMMC2535]
MERPLVTDYLRVAEHEGLDLELRLRLGAVEVGLIAVREGAVVDAEFPGVEGDAALELIAEIAGLRVEPTASQARPRRITANWRTLFASQLRADDPDRVTRTKLAYAQLRALALLDGEAQAQPQARAKTRPASSPSTPTTSSSPALSSASLAILDSQDAAEQALLELMHFGAIEAYLRGDLELARVAASRCAALSGSATDRANLERIRLRQLERDAWRHRDHQAPAEDADS